MTRTRLLALGLLLSFTALAGAEDKKPEKLDPAKLVGDWTLTEGVKAGEKTEKPKGLATLTKDKITLKSDDMTFVFSYKIDDKKDPVAVDFEILEPEGLKGGKAPGIIKLEGDKMTLIYHPMMGERPTKFESTKDNGFYLFTYTKGAKK